MCSLKFLIIFIIIMNLQGNLGEDYACRLKKDGQITQKCLDYCIYQKVT